MAPRTLNRGGPRDVWRRSPTSELTDQVLPRWFVLLALALIPVAIGAIVVALSVTDVPEVPVAARRPPPTATLTSDVGEERVGPLPPVVVDPAPCGLLEGVAVAGTEAGRAVLVEGLSALCDAGLPAREAALVRAFADGGGVVQLAIFGDAGVDSTADLDGGRVLVNARFLQTDPSWIGPVVVHDLLVLDGTPGTVVTALDARRGELAACAALFEGDLPSRGCRDADALLALPDAAAQLRSAGYR